MIHKRGGRTKTTPIDHARVFAHSVVDGRMKSALRINAIKRGYASLLGHRPNAVEWEQIRVAATQRFLIELAEIDACNVGSTDAAGYLAMVQDHERRLMRLGLLKPLGVRPVHAGVHAANDCSHDCTPDCSENVP